MNTIENIHVEATAPAKAWPSELHDMISGIHHSDVDFLISLIFGVEVATESKLYLKDLSIPSI